MRYSIIFPIALLAGSQIAVARPAPIPGDNLASGTPGADSATPYSSDPKNTHLADGPGLVKDPGPIERRRNLRGNRVRGLPLYESKSDDEDDTRQSTTRQSTSGRGASGQGSTATQGTAAQSTTQGTTQDPATAGTATADTPTQGTDDRGPWANEDETSQMPELGDDLGNYKRLR